MYAEIGLFKERDISLVYHNKMDLFNPIMAANLTTSAGTLYEEQQYQRQHDAGSQQTGLPSPFLATNLDGTFNQTATDRSNVDIMDNMRDQYMNKRSIIQQQVSAVDVSRKLLAQYQVRMEEASVLFKTIEAQLVVLQDAEIVEDTLRSEEQAKIVGTAATIRAAQKKADSAMKIHKKDVRHTQDRINKEETDLTVMQTEFATFKVFIRDMGAPVDQWEGVQLADIGDKDFVLLPAGNHPRNVPPKMATGKKTFLEQLNPESLAIPFTSGMEMDVQYSDGMYIPAFESKAHNQRTLHKMMQELEVRLKWPLTIETERELYALSEFQATLALTANPRLELFAQKVREIKAVIEANKHYLDRLTIVQLELQLIPKMSRQAIAITLQSLGRQPAYRKELSKPGHFDTRKSLHMTLPGEVKLDPSANWKNPNKKVSMAVARPRSELRRKMSSPFRSAHRGLKGRRFPVLSNRARGHVFIPKRKMQRPRSNQRHKRDLTEVQRGPNDRSKGMTCFNCQRKGHIKRNCPNMAAQNALDVNQPTTSTNT